eukprot:8445275-Pyramimonas_sp.AAC.3
MRIYPRFLRLMGAASAGGGVRGGAVRAECGDEDHVRPQHGLLEASSQGVQQVRRRAGGGQKSDAERAGAPHSVSDWSVVRIYPRFLRLTGPPCERPRNAAVREGAYAGGDGHGGGAPARHVRRGGAAEYGRGGHEPGAPLPVSDWSVVRIYPRFLRLIGPQGVQQVRRRAGGGQKSDAERAGAPLPVSDWSVVRIYPRFMRMIGPQTFMNQALEDNDGEDLNDFVSAPMMIVKRLIETQFPTHTEAFSFGRSAALYRELVRALRGWKDLPSVAA